MTLHGRRGVLHRHRRVLGRAAVRLLTMQFRLRCPCIARHGYRVRVRDAGLHRRHVDLRGARRQAAHRESRIGWRHWLGAGGIGRPRYVAGVRCTLILTVAIATTPTVASATSFGILGACAKRTALLERARIVVRTRFLRWPGLTGLPIAIPDRKSVV